MRSYKIVLSILLSFSLLALSACVKPQNHQSKTDDSATFYVGDVKATSSADDLIEGYSVPTSRLYNIVACAKDRRTDEALQGVPFEVSESDQIEADTATDKNGCANWRERVPFDFLAQEIYLPMPRTLTLKGMHVGPRQMNLAVNPWVRSSGAAVLVDLDHQNLPAKNLSTSQTASSSARRLFIASLPLKNSTSDAAGSTVSRNIKISIDPSVTLTDINGNPVNVPLTVKPSKLLVSASLVESITEGGIESKSVVSKVEPAALKIEDGKLTANLQFNIRKGSSASRYFIALTAKPIDGPKNLKAFEGVFSVGDLKSLTESGTSTAELKTSNADAAFTIESYVSGAALVSASDADGSNDSSESGSATANHGVKTSRFTGKSGRAPSVPQNSGSGSRLGAFQISRVEPTWSAVAGGVDATNKRTIMYRLKTCITDSTNGGRPASGVEFSIVLANKSVIKRTTTTLNGLDGCLEWEDKITHRYYEAERFFVIPVTFKHRSGFSETRTYAIDPWQSFRFSADAAAQPEMIDAVSQRTRIPTKMLVRSVDFNTVSSPRYQVDDFLGLTAIKPVALSIPISMIRASNIVDGINAPPEPLRQGRYLLKAAYVTPIRKVLDKSAELVVAPMIGLNRIVNVEGGQLSLTVEFPITDVRLMNARSYIAFELYLIDETKIPANDPYLRKSKIDPVSLIDRKSNVTIPTFIGALNMKQEKDSAILLNSASLALAMPMSDRINSITNLTSLVSAPGAEPFANITVDRLYAIAEKSRREYRARMSKEVSLSNVAARSNSDVVFINNEVGNSRADSALLRNNRIIGSSANALRPLLVNLNAQLDRFGSGSAMGMYAGGRPIVGAKALAMFVRGQVPFHPKLATQFCGYFFGAVLRSKVSGLKLAMVEGGDPGSWMDMCIAEVRARGPDSAFLVDHRIRVLKSTGAQFVRGRTLEVSTGANISFAQMQTTSQGWGVGMGTSGVIGEFSKRALLGQGNKALKLFTSAVGVSGVGAEITRSNSTSAMISGGFGFDVRQSLIVEQTELKIGVSESDECAIIRPRPKLFESYRSTLYMKILSRVLGEKEAVDLMGRGLMICSGAVDKTMRVLPERYYTFGMNLSGGNILDPRNVNNLPWLLSLRGQRDYASFLVMASGQKTSVAQAKDEPMDLGDLPSAKLQETYEQIFAGKLSTMPGFITNEPKVLFKRVN